MVALNLARFRIQYDKVRSVLVVCPPSLILNWHYTIQELTEYNSLPLVGTRNDKLFKINKDYMFNVISYDSLPPIKRKGLKNSDVHNELLNKQYDMIIYDESSRYIRSPETNRTKASIKLSDQAKYRMILTGSPIADNPLNLWSQFRALDLGNLFGRNYYVYRSVFFEKDERIHRWYLKPKYYGVIKNKIASTCIQFSKDECIKDMPESVFQTIKLGFSPTGRQDYLELKTKVIAEIETELGKANVNVQHAFQKLVRLQQFTSGYTKDEYGVEKRLKETPKLDALIDELQGIIEERNSAIVWCKFRFSINMIEEELRKLKIKYLTMHGDTKDKYAAWKGFQQSREHNIFIGQIVSGGIGIELFKLEDTEKNSQYTFFYENDWVPDVRLQATGRPNRIGQRARTLFYKDLVLEKTIDEYILQTISDKKKVIDSLVNLDLKTVL